MEDLETPPEEMAPADDAAELAAAADSDPQVAPQEPPRRDSGPTEPEETIVTAEAMPENAGDTAAPQPEAQFSMEDLLSGAEAEPEPVSLEDSQLRAVLEAIVYVAEEPLTLAQLAAALQQPAERIRSLLDQLVAEFDRPEHGVTIREVAGGFKMATKAEHHDAVRAFVKSLKPPLKLSLPALETLAVIAYKQPCTGPGDHGDPRRPGRAAS